MATKIIAHRGASKLAPENTMPAFELAYQMGAEGIETDVQLTKDQIPVLIHDETVNRTSNGTGLIKEYTFAQLKQLDFGSWFSKEFCGTPIVSLEEFLQWSKQKPFHIHIELKNNKINYDNMETIVHSMVRDFGLLERTTFSTFNPASVKRMKDMLDEVEVALLLSKQNNKLISYLKELRADAVHIKYRLLNEMLVYACHRENIIVRSYTINWTRHMAHCFKVNCDGIFTDVPGKALKVRQQFFQRKK